MAFLALEKKLAGASGHSRSCSLNRENLGRVIETRRYSRDSFFENETIFVFITPRSWANLALKNFFIMPAQQPIRVRVLLWPYNKGIYVPRCRELGMVFINDWGLSR